MKPEYCKLGDILGEALRQYNFDQTITQAQVKEAYERVVGPMLMKLTYSIHYDTVKHTLYLRLASPALRQEYSYKLSDLMESINSQVASSEAKVRRIVLG